MGMSLTNRSDPETAQYFDKTFHGTYTEGDQMVLTFNGSAVYVYGSRRPDHGIYTGE